MKFKIKTTVIYIKVNCKVHGNDPPLDQYGNRY